MTDKNYRIQLLQCAKALQSVIKKKGAKQDFKQLQSHLPQL